MRRFCKNRGFDYTRKWLSSRTSKQGRDTFCPLMRLRLSRLIWFMTTREAPKWLYRVITRLISSLLLANHPVKIMAKITTLLSLITMHLFWPQTGKFFALHYRRSLCRRVSLIVRMTSASWRWSWPSDPPMAPNNTPLRRSTSFSRLAVWSGTGVTAYL